MAMFAAAVLVLLLHAAAASRELTAYHCRENLREWEPKDKDDYVRSPCRLRVCGNYDPVTNTHPSVTYTDEYGTTLRKLYGPGVFSKPNCTYFTNPATYTCFSEMAAFCNLYEYRARVSHGHEEMIANISARAEKPFEDVDPLRESCYPPVINPPTATLVPGTRHNVLVRWTYRQKFSNIKNCNGSRQFHVSIRPYLTYELAKSTAGLENWEQGYTALRRRVTNYTYIVSPNMYYRFFVRGEKGVEQPPPTLTNPVFSRVYYFGEHVPIVWDVNMALNYILREGGSTDLVCTATGTPTPTITYRKLGHTAKLPFKRLNHVSAEDGGTYICEACQKVFDNSIGGFKTVCDDVDISVTVISRHGDQSCELYTGTECSEFIYQQWRVFDVNSTRGDIDTRIRPLVNTHQDFSSDCQNFIKSILCHTALPYCDIFSVNTPNYSPLSICRKTCTELRRRCGGEIEEKGEWLASQIYRRCETEERGPGDKPGCIYVDPDSPLRGGEEMDTVSHDIADLECIHGNGKDYRGRMREVTNGRSCQMWSSQYPNRHSFDLLTTGELEGAGRFCRNPGGLGKRPWCFVNSIRQRWGYCDVPNCEECVPYSGDYCSSVGYTSTTSVLLRRSIHKSLTDFEVVIKAMMHTVQEEEEDLTPGCELVAQQLLCYSALPVCHDNDQQQQEQCNSHCSLLDLLSLCPRSLQDTVLSVSFLNLNLSTCEENHDSLVALATSNEACPPPSVVLLNLVETSNDDCYNKTDLGQTYRGAMETTKEGIQCRPWKESVLGKKPWSDIFPELDKSFCRNPGQLREVPWCFTSTEGDWDYCDLPICSNEPPIDSLQQSPDSNSNTVIIGTMSTLTVIIIVGGIVGVIVTIVYMRHNITQTRHMESGSLPPQATNFAYFSNTGAVNPKLKDMAASIKKIKRSKIRYLRELGQGNFGTVFQGECDGVEWEDEEVGTGVFPGEPVKVAVKTHKEATDSVVEDFVHEANISQRLVHDNIIKFYGVCMDTLPFFMIFEYMDLGDLCQYLRCHSSSAQRRYNPPMVTSGTGRQRMSSSVSNDSATLGTTELLGFCRQIASGMAYLESEQHIHRDLAARNCLINSSREVKLADFGMSQNLYSKDYYRMAGDACLPIRWMAPESIVYGTFSSKGDVWAYGVVVWEIFSFGMQPYWGHANEAVVQFIRRGTLLDKPEDCPDQLYDLIKTNCWNIREEGRSSFQQLVEELSSLRLSDSDDSFGSSPSPQAMDTMNDEVFFPANDDDRD